MGMTAYDDPAELMAQVSLAGKRAYVIPNGSTVIPKLKSEA